MSIQVMKYKNKTIVCPPVYKGTTTLDAVHPLKKLRIFPNPWNYKVNEQLMKVSKKIAAVLNVEGVIEIEFIVKDNGDYHVTEINSRLSGVTRMIAYGGINVIDMLLSTAKGEWEICSVQKTLKSTLEIPINTPFSEQDINTLNSFQFVKYTYVRPDSNGTRQRILLRGGSLQKLVKYLNILDGFIDIDKSRLEEVKSLISSNETHMT
jgi:carbamoylphosphate synthase large subunit